MNQAICNSFDQNRLIEAQNAITMAIVAPIEARERALAGVDAVEEATAGAARALEPKEPLSVPVLSKQPTHEFAAYS